jgi:hypothetical protein
MKPVTDPREQAELAQRARRLRFEGSAKGRSEDYARWHAYAAHVMEVGAGTVDPMAGQDASAQHLPAGADNKNDEDRADATRKSSPGVAP